MRQTIYIKYENKKCPVIITDDWEGKDEIDKKYNTILIECKAGNFRQSILVEDLPGFLENLPDIMKQKKLMEQEISLNKSEVFQMRLSATEKVKLKTKAKQDGYKSISSYIKAKVLQD